jgi:MFS family permease
VPGQIFLGALVQAVLVVVASLAGGRLSDRTGRRKVFVLVASIVYGSALFVLAAAGEINGFLVGMAISGLGFGVYFAVDLALVTQVLPDDDSPAKNLGVFNIAGALPFTIAPAIAPAVLAVGGGSYGVLYTVAGLCAVVGAFAILPVRRVRCCLAVVPAQGRRAQTTGAPWRDGTGVLSRAAIAAGRKPLTVRYTPTENSKTATGRAYSRPGVDVCPGPPRIVTVYPTRAMGPPTRPKIGMTRPTSPDLYRR